MYLFSLLFCAPPASSPPRSRHVDHHELCQVEICDLGAWFSLEMEYKQGKARKCWMEWYRRMQLTGSWGSLNLTRHAVVQLTTRSWNLKRECVPCCSEGQEWPCGLRDCCSSGQTSICGFHFVTLSLLMFRWLLLGAVALCMRVLPH